MFQELIDNITNVEVFTGSIQAWISNISINSVIMLIMMIFMIVGAVDRIRGNKLGYGEKFEEGFNAMGSLAIAMAGVVAAAPVLAIILKPILVPIYGLVGADPSMFATTILACDMGGYPLAMQLAVVGYTLTVAMLIPVSGWLADRFGTRRVFISAVNFFILGSLLCALSTSLPMLVASRVLQGIGGAMMMPVARLAVLRAYPRTELVAVLNFISIPGLVGPVVGPLLGGWLVTYATWHWIFLINIPIGLIGILYAYHIMPDFTAPRRPFDWMGFFLFGLSLVSFSSGLEVFGDRVGPDFLPPVLLISGIALLGLYIRHARRHPSPLIRLSVFRTRTFSVGIGGNILSRLGTGCVPFLMPLMLQVGLGYPALVAGAMMAPTAIGSITAKTFAMKILNRFGYRVTLTGVTVCIGLMIAQFALQTPTLPLWMLILPLFMLGMAMSTQFTAMNSITLGDLSTEDASTGNGLLSVTQQLSISFGVASSTVVLRFYNSFASGTLLDHFHYTFITIGGITMMAAFVFMLLRKDDGDSLLPGRKKPVFETTSSSTPRNP